VDKVRPTASGLLADALDAAGHHLPMPCRGRHSCGKCSVYLAGDTAPPDEQEAALLARYPQPALPGFEQRMACLARLGGEVSIVASSIGQVVVADVGQVLTEYDGTSPDSCGLAVDIGTTTITVLAFRLGDQTYLGDLSQLNHQVAHGADVLSRIEAANQRGVGPLHDLVVEQVGTMVAQVLTQAQLAPDQVTRVTVTGNTTMLHLLRGLAVRSLGVSPFTPLTRFGDTVPAADLFPTLVNAELYLPPAISAYVGPDIVCGLVATGLGAHGRVGLLVDVGTNGEMALAVGQQLWCCSTAAGPAFEGAEISCGMPALPGAIDEVWADPAAPGGLRCTTIGHQRAKGLCGTGLIGAVNAGLDLGLIDSTGAMTGGPLAIGDSTVQLTQADVRQLQLAKAAIAAGLDTLLHQAGLTAEQVDSLQLAGGFGSYLQPGPAAGIGLIPAALAGRASPGGNTALTGAILLTVSSAARRTAEQRARVAQEVGLATHPVFLERYIDQMAFRDDD
jgi:uncharacterized 2Fe-2S/4Fe-4S cluster protein (DUF4445 family)